MTLLAEFAPQGRLMGQTIDALSLIGGLARRQLGQQVGDTLLQSLIEQRVSRWRRLLEMRQLMEHDVRQLVARLQRRLQPGRQLLTWHRGTEAVHLGAHQQAGVGRGAATAEHTDDEVDVRKQRRRIDGLEPTQASAYRWL
ncbi:hypothetical protein RQP53_04935 [Paucibacter sp. APW11]|uniref:Uncharacterized protein n=1 Tax=Roseateles aquae TaxID=3077235 RepID=A0ABU3P7Q9_9BURK|nr:hypothetical protein [Paucibacter sp. APW11]MDT8998612.1 hypothetical protein [Paucibacter sp. APW11]